ncbi:MAG: hypothetical protein LUH22_17810 [Bacteroides sp.]|nr:hypothetical protein [Bacteroides sp.]
MKDYNDDYFFLGLVESPNYPMLDLHDDFEDYAMDFLMAEPIEYTEPIQLIFGDPIPRKPIMVDYHDFVTPSPIFSEKLKNVIEGMGIKDIQFVPVLIHDKSDDLIYGYYAIKVYNEINCVDLNKSKYDLSSYNGKITSLSKLVLDNEKLDKIPLENRLIFAVEECGIYVLYHISVVEKMLDIVPEGMTVYRLSGWDSSSPFYEVYGKYLKGLMK